MLWSGFDLMVARVIRQLKRLYHSLALSHQVLLQHWYRRTPSLPGSSIGRIHKPHLLLGSIPRSDSAAVQSTSRCRINLLSVLLLSPLQLLPISAEIVVLLSFCIIVGGGLSAVSNESGPNDERPLILRRRTSC